MLDQLPALTVAPGGNLAKAMLAVCMIGNSLVTELWVKEGLKTNKIVGTATLDIVRSNKFGHETTGAGIDGITVPIIGGNAGSTIFPFFSQDGCCGDICQSQKLHSPHVERLDWHWNTSDQFAVTS